MRGLFVDVHAAHATGHKCNCLIIARMLPSIFYLILVFVLISGDIRGDISSWR